MSLGVFFKDYLDVFLIKKWVWEQRFFLKKSRKKCIVLTSLAPNPFIVVLTELTFFWTKYGHGTRGFLIKWSPTSRGEGWSLRNCVSRVSKGGTAITRKTSVNQKWQNLLLWICFKKHTSLCFKNICESDKSIVIYIFTVCCFFFEYLSKRSVNTLSDFVRISFKNISESDHDLHFPIYSKHNQQTVTKFHYILDLGSFVGAGRLFKYKVMRTYSNKWTPWRI